MFLQYDDKRARHISLYRTLFNWGPSCHCRKVCRKTQKIGLVPLSHVVVQDQMIEYRVQLNAEPIELVLELFNRYDNHEGIWDILE